MKIKVTLVMLNNFMYSEISIIEKLPLEKNHTYLINFIRTGQVQNNFDIPTCSAGLSMKLVLWSQSLGNVYHFVESFFCAAFGVRFMPLYGMQACLLHSWRCDLCRNDGALPYGGILTFLREKVAISWSFFHGSVMSLETVKNK